MTRLKDLRNKKQLSQSMFANSTGISVRVLQSYEQGKRSIDGAKLDTLVNFCQVLDCKLSDIVEDDQLKDKLTKSGY